MAKSGACPLRNTRAAEKRERIALAYFDGVSIDGLCSRFGVHKGTVHAAVKAYRERKRSA